MSSISELKFSKPVKPPKTMAFLHCRDWFFKSKQKWWLLQEGLPIKWQWTGMSMPFSLYASSITTYKIQGSQLQLKCFEFTWNKNITSRTKVSFRKWFVNALSKETIQLDGGVHLSKMGWLLVTECLVSILSWFWLFSVGYNICLALK